MDEPRHSPKWREVRSLFHDKVFRSRNRQNLSILKSALLGVKDVWYHEVEEAEYELRKCFLQTHIAERTDLGWTVLVGFVRVQYDDIILNLLAVLIGVRFEQGPYRGSERIRHLSIKAYHGEELVQNLTNALATQDAAFSQATQPEARDALAEIYAAFFQRAKEFNQNAVEEVDRRSTNELREQLCRFVQNLGGRVASGNCTLEWIQSSRKSVVALQAFPVDIETCKAISGALAHIVDCAKNTYPKLSRLTLQHFTLAALRIIAPCFPSPDLSSLGDNEVLIEHFASILNSPDNTEWLEFFAAAPAVWLPTTHKARKLWKESGFASDILIAFKTARGKARQEYLASVMVHIASTGSTDWCAQLIRGSLTEVAEQVITGKQSDININPSISVATALRPFIAVLVAHPIDWATDQMYRIVGALSTSLNPKTTPLFKQIIDTYSTSDINNLIKFIEEVSERRKYEGEQRNQVIGAVANLRGINKRDRSESSKCYSS
ncbi:hypothetical protein FRB90_005773 [Tulasnella sp. 427]|nr:hypothetical protein FRB90_005773 [Tulasnella sp. 427]